MPTKHMTSKKKNIMVHNKDHKSAAYKTLIRQKLEIASTAWLSHNATYTDVKKKKKKKKKKKNASPKLLHNLLHVHHTGVKVWSI